MNLAKIFLAVAAVALGFFSFSLTASAADSDYNSPTQIEASSVDTSVNYFPVASILGTSGTNSNSFPPSPVGGGNVLMREPAAIYNGAINSGGIRYYTVDGLSNYTGDLVFTCSNFTAINHRYEYGAHFQFCDSNNNVLPCEYYVDGVLTSNTVFLTPSVSLLSDGLVHHYEMYIHCTTPLQRIIVNYTFNDRGFYWRVPSYPFGNTCLFKYSESRTFTLNASLYQNGAFKTILTQDFPEGDYRCKLIYCDLPAMVSPDSSSTSDSSETKPEEGERLLLKLFSSHGVPADDTGAESAFDEYRELLFEKLDTFGEFSYTQYQNVRSVVEGLVRAANVDILNGRAVMEYTREESENFGRYFIDSAPASAPFGSLQDFQRIVANYLGDCFYYNYATKAYLGSAAATTKQAYVDTSIYYPYQIFDTTINQYLDFNNPFIYKFDFGTFYKAFGSSDDWPADNVISFVYLIYNDDDICVAAFRLDVDVYQYLYDSIHSVGDIISRPWLPSLKDDSSYPLLDVSSGADDITRRELALYLSDLADIYYKNISAQLTNIYNMQRYNSSISNYNYYYAITPDDSFTDVLADYNFDISIDEGLGGGMALTRDFVTDIINDYRLENYLLLLLGVAAVSFVLYGRK